MNVVVTGAAGFIGSHLAEALQAAGHDVRGIDSFTDYYDPRIKEENASALSVDRLDLADEELDFSSIDAVFHLAAQPGVRSFGDVFPAYVRANVLGSQRVFEAAARAGARVVFASSSSVYGEAARVPTPEDVTGEPRSPYGITKLAGEHLAHAYAAWFGLDVVVLRYFTVYGPRQRPDMAFARIASALAEGTSFPLYGDGSQSRASTYVDDAVAATVSALEAAPGAVYNVGGGQEATLNEVIGLLERIAGRTLEIDARPAAAGDVRRIAADTSRIQRELGWRPRTPLEQGLRAQWEWTAGRLAAA